MCGGTFIVLVHTLQNFTCTYMHITKHLEKNKKLAIEGSQDGRLSFPYIPGGENLFPLRQPRAHEVHQVLNAYCPPVRITQTVHFTLHESHSRRQLMHEIDSQFMTECLFFCEFSTNNPDRYRSRPFKNLPMCVYYVS